jgi:hypothetical protein
MIASELAIAADVSGSGRDRHAVVNLAVAVPAHVAEVAEMRRNWRESCF